MTRSTGKRDVNHADIRDALRDVPGMWVMDIADYPRMGADLLVVWQDAPPLFVEIKDGPKAPLTDSEKRMRDRLGRHWMRAEAMTDVLAHLGLSNEAPPW